LVPITVLTWREVVGQWLGRSSACWIGQCGNHPRHHENYRDLKKSVRMAAAAEIEVSLPMMAELVAAKF
jgi:hypothetical protein